MVIASSPSDRLSSVVEVRARSFGPNAVEYADYRPGYPASAVGWALSGIRAPDPLIIDLGAGTGKLSQTVSEFKVRALAVEPDVAMCAEMRRRVPGVEVIQGSAESIPLPDRCADGVLIGQALHWFDYELAMNEIARVLKPGGRVAALWNQNDNSVGWVSEFSRLANSTPLAKKWFEEYSELPDHQFFEPSGGGIFQHSWRHTSATLIEAACTESHILISSDERRRTLREKLRVFLSGLPETTNGEFDLPLVTKVLRASSKSE
jgi:SAM-dependent methyltransferase